MANAKSNVKDAVAKAQEAAAKAAAALKAAETAAAAKPAKAATDKFSELHHKVCDVTGGKKHKGETVSVLLASNKPNRWGSMAALCLNAEGEQVWIDQKHLTATGDMDAKIAAAFDKKREDENNETLYIAANVGSEKDAAIRLDYAGWFKSLWFPKSMVTKTGVNNTDANATPIFEIVAWKVKREVGMDSYMALKAKQDELAAIVAKG